jgi:CRP-like cAMP-binding protein
MRPDLFNYADPAQTLDAPGAGLILQGLDQAAWDTFLGFVEHLSFPAGSLILQASESGRSIYILRVGHVRGQVQAGSKIRQTGRLGPGAVFGELGFFDGEPRSASLWADDDVELLVMSLAGFDRMAVWHPRLARELLMDLGRVLSQRLRRAESQR